MGQVLGDDPAVGFVVVLQPGQVQQGGTDVGLVGPGAGGAAAGHGDLPAVRPGGARPVGGGRAVQAEMGDAGPGDAEPVGVDLGGVVTVVPGEARVLGDARAA